MNLRNLIKSGVPAFFDLPVRELNRAFQAILTRSTEKFFPIGSFGEYNCLFAAMAQTAGGFGVSSLARTHTQAQSAEARCKLSL
jgi:hypothetical protein